MTRAKKSAEKTADEAREAEPKHRVMVSPLNGATCPTGAHPGNTGGKPGRSGRRPDEVRLQLARIRDKKATKLISRLIDGEVSYTLNGTCEHCGQVSRGESIDDAAKRIPSPDVRFRAAEMTYKYTVGPVHQISAEEVQGRLRETLAIIRRTLPSAQAEALIEAMKPVWTA